MRSTSARSFTGIAAICLSAILASVFFCGSVYAKSSYLGSFTAKYPAAAGSKLESCGVCHGSGGNSTWNPYGQAIKSTSGADITARITAVQGQDSDGDGFSNLAEITALTYPGDPADKPASPPPPPPGDTTPPVVSSTVPVQSAVSVAVTTSITASFNEAIDPSTLSTATFKLSSGAGNVAGTVSLSGNTATFRPSASLAYGTVYTATITTGVKDVAGNALAANYTWTFTTGSSPDVTPPSVTTTSPAGNQTGVAVNTTVSATFSEPINAATLTSGTFTLKSGGAVIPGTVSLSGNTATFQPSGPLAYSTAYTATVTTGVKDAAGNAMTANKSWTFTTGAAADTTPPSVSSTSPVSNQSGVPVSAAVTATFSETVDAATVTIASFKLMNGANAVTGTVSLNGATARFTPSAPLANGAAYTAILTTGIKDSAGNALPAEYSWSFTTGQAADTSAPEVSSIDPSSSQSVANNAIVTVTFNEAVDPATVTTDSFMVSDGSNNVLGAVSVNGQIAEFSPAAPLFDNTTYTVTVTTAVKDLAGNSMASQYSSTFSTLPEAVVPTPATGTEGEVSGGGCAMAAGTRGGAGGFAGAYGALVLAAMALAFRGRRGKKK